LSFDSFLAVRVNRDRFFDRVALAFGERRDLLFAVRNGRERLKIKDGIGARVRRNFDILRRRRVQIFRPIVFRHRNRNFLTFVRIIAHGHGQRDFVALGQNTRRIELGKKRLKGLKFLFDQSDLTRFGRAERVKFPRCQIIAELEFKFRFAEFIGN
jgi:hypothetical protein